MYFGYEQRMSANLLIVEDDTTVRKLLGEWLHLAFPSCQVLQAATAEEGLGMIQATPPQVVIMDIGLPGMNGIEATRRIKADVPEAAVVILTIHEDDAYRKDAAVAGACAYIPKRKIRTDLIPTLKTLLPTDGNQEAEQ